MEPDRVVGVLAEATRARAAPTGRDADVEIDLERFESPMSSDHLRAVMHELVENALKFSEPGSAVIVRGRRDGAAAYLLERDGPGTRHDGRTDRGGRRRAVPSSEPCSDRPGAEHRLPSARRDLRLGRLSFGKRATGGTSVAIRFPPALRDRGGAPAIQSVAGRVRRHHRGRRGVACVRPRQRGARADAPVGRRPSAPRVRRRTRGRGADRPPHGRRARARDVHRRSLPVRLAGRAAFHDHDPPGGAQGSGFIEFRLDRTEPAPGCRSSTATRCGRQSSSRSPVGSWRGRLGEDWRMCRAGHCRRRALPRRAYAEDRPRHL